MKHGEGITLTLTGRCPILCPATINNMAASGAFALEKGVHSESHVLTTDYFFLVLYFFKDQTCCLFCDFFSDLFMGLLMAEILPVGWLHTDVF